MKLETLIALILFMIIALGIFIMEYFAPSLGENIFNQYFQGTLK